VSDQYIRSLHTLGVTKQDIAETIINAYELQVEADPACAKAYFSALFKLQEVSLTGRELIQTKVAVEQSLDRYTDGKCTYLSGDIMLMTEDLADAYRLIGYEADAIGIEPENAPDDFIFKLHKEAQNAATTSDERRLVNKALLVIGKERENALMIRLGKEGQSFVSVEDAYAALGAPREATDEGLLMCVDLNFSHRAFADL
jgi:ubiquitin carboxyl-terminal hydrolase 25/28